MLLTPIKSEAAHLMTHSSLSALVSMSTDTSVQQDRISNGYHGRFIISMADLPKPKTDYLKQKSQVRNDYCQIR